MHKIKEIKLSRWEGPTNNCGTFTVATFEQADDQLRSWSWSAPEKGQGYDKCGFTITFENGETYEGRYDLNRGTIHSLQQHVQNFLLCMSGQKKPRHWTDEQYQTVLNRSPELTERCKKFIAEYDLGFTKV